jgi:RNA polymerase sigma-54 factor
LQQAIKLLALSHAEMAQLIRQEIEQNPVLEELEPGPYEGGNGAADRFVGPQSSYDGPAPIETTVACPTTLVEHLRWQVHMAELGPVERDIALFLVEEINDDGYLNPDAVAMAAQDYDVSPQDVDNVLAIIQQFDPPGVGARDLKECLILQAGQAAVPEPLVLSIIEQCLAQVEKQQLGHIARQLKVPLGEVQRAVRAITHLEPKPGRSFTHTQTHFITPDLYVYKVGPGIDDWTIAINDEGLPQVCIGAMYQNCASDAFDQATRDYLQDKLRGASWLMRSMQMRARTMYRVMQSILSFQRDFFELGVGHLKPLILREVAQDVGMHESTISRVTTSKYVHTPQGIYPLKFFFNSAIAQFNGEALASQSVRSHIQRLIGSESPGAPLSDQRLVELLREHDIDIARRTVAKYRDMLGIAPSSRRKRVY